MPALSPEGKQSFVTSAGVPLVGGRLYTYDAGTNTPRPTFADAAGTTPNTNPVILDARGEATIFWQGSYKVVLRDAADVIIWTVDNVTDPESITNTLRADLASTASGKGAALVGYQQAGVGAVSRTALAKLREVVTPLDFMSSAQLADVLAGTQAVDVTSAFIAAQAASLHVRVPGFKYLINDQIDILDNQTWEFQGADIKHTDETKNILRANGKTGWRIIGSVTLRGTLVSADTKAETGLYITDCKKYRVEGVTARNFKGKGIWLDGVNNPGVRGDRGQFTDCAAFDCTVGRQIDAGAGAEYNTWTNFNASGCVTGSVEAAGNNTTIGGSIVDNTTGVRLLAGANHCHGMYVGVNINHNNSANIWATGVTNGHTFVACHAYGNGGSTGPIWFQGCKGMQFVGGVIDCWIYNDSGAGSGANFVTNNYFPGDYGVTLVSNNAALGQLYLRDNFAPTGPSSLNDSAAVAALVSRATNQALTAGTAVKAAWDVESIDNRGFQSGGDFTIPTPGTQLYEISADVYVSAASGIAAGGFVEVRVNGTGRATWPLASINASNASAGGGSTLLALENGDVLTLWVTANTGSVSPVLSSGQSRMSVLLRG